MHSIHYLISVTEYIKKSVYAGSYHMFRLPYIVIVILYFPFVLLLLYSCYVCSWFYNKVIFIQYFYFLVIATAFISYNRKQRKQRILGIYPSQKKSVHAHKKKVIEQHFNCSFLYLKVRVKSSMQNKNSHLTASLRHPLAHVTLN